MRRLKPLPLKPDRLRVGVKSAALGVDRKENVLRGYVMAQEGPFKSAGRGEFDAESISAIVRLANATPRELGLRSRFTHPTESDDGLGKYLGRARNARIDGDKARADLHFDRTAFETPNGNLAKYVMDLAESDPDAISSSLVLSYDEEWRLDSKNRKITGPDGDPLPPLWRPKKLYASDIVDTGDAVDGLLSAGICLEGLPDVELWKGVALLDGAFRDQSREVVKARCLSFLDRYLGYRFGELASDDDIPAEEMTGPACPLSKCGGMSRELGTMAKCAKCGHTFMYNMPEKEPDEDDKAKNSTPVLDGFRERLKRMQMMADMSKIGKK